MDDSQLAAIVIELESGMKSVWRAGPATQAASASTVVVDDATLLVGATDLESDAAQRSSRQLFIATGMYSVLFGPWLVWLVIRRRPATTKAVRLM
ncbi:MAG: hypothetical protein QM770_10385 [Tepidisphaeraceae bacterium]